MVKTGTDQNFKNKLIINGLQIAGKAIGLNASKSTTKRTIEKNLSLVNSLMRVGFMHRNGSQAKMKQNIEWLGLGAIVFYNFYKGFRQKQKKHLAQGIFLSTALLFVVVASGVNKKNISQ